MADSYRATLSDNVFKINGKEMLGPTTRYGHPNPNASRDGLTMPEKMATYALDSAVKTKGQDPAVAAIRHLKKYGKDNPDANAAIGLIQQWKNQGSSFKAGHLYTLDLPDEMIDRMLDWDKPLSEQPLIVDALRKSEAAGIGGASDGWRGAPSGMWERAVASPSKTGEWLYQEIANNDSRATVETLRQLGIPGIRYLDAGSRGKDGTGTRNFVVFPGEEKKVKVLRRE